MEVPLKTAAMWAVEANLKAAELGLEHLAAIHAADPPAGAAPDLRDARRLVTQALRSLNAACALAAEKQSAALADSIPGY